jgi:uncharacterized protein (TIGR02284 family)
MSYSEEISNKLNELLSKNYDAEKGYINASKNVDSERLKLFFQERASERSYFAKELRTDILMFGRVPGENGSLTGTMHRNWMTLKSLVSSNDEVAILEEALRGEKASLEEYNELVNKDIILPPTTESLLLKQRDAIQGAINSIKMQEEVSS